MMSPEAVIQDFNDAVQYQKANARSRQTGGLPLKVQCTSMMFEDRTGYQLFTTKLKPADVVVDQEVFDALPNVMMEKIDTADGGQPLYIRCKCLDMINTHNTPKRAYSHTYTTLTNTC